MQIATKFVVAVRPYKQICIRRGLLCDWPQASGVGSATSVSLRLRSQRKLIESVDETTRRDYTSLLEAER